MSQLFPWWKFCENNGGGRVCFVWYAAGMPWAVSSLDLDLSGDEQVPPDATHWDSLRRRMFGHQKATEPSTDVYPADDVEILPWLEVPGRQAVNVEDTQALPSGGDWEIKIADLNPGVEWEHTNNSRTVWGLDGLSTIPDYRTDSKITAVTLASTFDKDDAVLYVKNDYGDRMKTLLNAALSADEQTYLWVGHEVVATKGAYVTDTGDEEFNVGVDRGMFKTVPQSHFIGQKNTKPIVIADAPLGGIAGRPCYLYAIIVDEDGVPLAESGIGAITDAAMVRHGRVGARVSRKDGTFKIKCSPWWDWLNQKVRKEPAWATLRGYHFTRGDDTTQDQYRGHLVLWEITDVGGDNDMNKRVIWLCAENSLVSFDTREELLDALQQELLLAYEAGAGGTTATGSDGTSYVYQVRPNGLHHDPTAQPDDSGPAPYYASFLGGPVAWALNLGPPNSNAMSERDDVLRRGSPWPAGDWASSPFPNWTWLRRVYWSTSDEMPQAYSPPDDNFSPYKPLWITWEVDDSWESVYYYQMDWNPWSGLDTTGYYPEWRTYDFLIPGDYYGSPGPSLYLDWSTSVSNFNSAEDIVIGAADRFLKDQPTRSTAAVSSLNTAANKIVINPGGSWSFPDYTISTPHFSAIAKHVASRASGNETESCFAYGGQLCYVPAIHDESAGGDPWPVHQTTYIEAQLASDLFKALLGDDSGELDIQEIFEFNNIPDAVDLDANGENEFYETIDWDSFDQIVQPPFPNSYYSLDIEGADINLYALLSEVLKLHGACATWEYDANKFQYVMKFRKIGVVNVSSANFSGRKINVDNRQIYATPSGEHSGDRLVSAVRARFNWNDGEGKYLININVDDEMNASATGGRRKEITIADKVTHIAGYSSSNNDLNNEIMRHFVENHLIKLAWPLPAQTVRGTLRCSMESPCGSPVLITDPAAFNMYTGAYGLTAHPGLVTGLIVDFKTGECGVTYRVSPGATKDWAPSVRITDSTISSNDVITVVTGEWDTSRYNTLVDNMTYFGNFTYNSSTGQTTQVDTDPYLCTIYEEGKNGMVFEKVSVAVNAGVTSVTLTLTDIGLTWSTSDNYIMTFGKWGDDLHDTQRLWLYMAQDDGTLDDGATVTPGQEWE